MPASQWFVRAAHAYVAAVTAPGADGRLYEVDMRLRPSGNKGPVAVSLPSFRATTPKIAWTWERMALTRARVVAGPPALRARIEAGDRRGAGGSAATPDRIRADAAAMRARMLRDLPPDGPWDVKLRAGGQIEVEFIAQVLQLVHARGSAGAVLAHHAHRARPAGQGGASPRGGRGTADPRRPSLAHRAGHAAHHGRPRRRRTICRTPPPRALLRAVAVALDGEGPVDLAGLRATLDDLARQVRAMFVRHVGEIGP